MLLDGLIQRWGIPGAVQRSPRRLQALRPPAGDGGGSHPVHPPAGIAIAADLRPLTPGQGPSGTHGGDLSGPSGHRTAPGGRPGPLARPRRCCGTSCRASTPVSPCNPSIRTRPTAQWPPTCDVVQAHPQSGEDTGAGPACCRHLRRCAVLAEPCRTPLCEEQSGPSPAYGRS